MSLFLWYNKATVKNNTAPICSQCGSRLIETSKITERIDGSLFPQTTTLYRCSNKECQEDRDEQTKKRLKMKKDKEIADLRRSEERLTKKRKFL